MNLRIKEEETVETPYNELKGRDEFLFNGERCGFIQTSVLSFAIWLSGPNKLKPLSKLPLPMDKVQKLVKKSVEMELFTPVNSAGPDAPFDG